MPNASESEAMKVAEEWKDREDTAWTDRFRLEDGRVGCGIAWQDENEDWIGLITHIGMNKEVYDAELFAIEQAMRRFVNRGQQHQHYTIFSDSQSALERCRNDKPGPGQAIARSIIYGSLVLAINRCKVTLRWVPAHKGVPGNEKADQLAKKAAKHPEEEREEGGVAARYYQLMAGHPVMASYLKDKLKMRDSDVCWWCALGRRQTHEYFFKECSRWKGEIKDLWRRVGKDVGWRRAKWKPIARLFREERANEAVLEFIRRTGVGRTNGTERPGAEDSNSDAESEG
ncbi:ribonuclease H-like domain-containing protein [Pyronema domesticum]|nr:ribonuclease H-like domain-containing protein [Pyronema domesticum]